MSPRERELQQWQHAGVVPEDIELSEAWQQERSARAADISILIIAALGIVLWAVGVIQ